MLCVIYNRQSFPPSLAVLALLDGVDLEWPEALQTVLNVAGTANLNLQHFKVSRAKACRHWETAVFPPGLVATYCHFAQVLMVGLSLLSC